MFSFRHQFVNYDFVCVLKFLCLAASFWIIKAIAVLSAILSLLQKNKKGLGVRAGHLMLDAL